jgi:hypothetical protein
LSFTQENLFRKDNNLSCSTLISLFSKHFAQSGGISWIRKKEKNKEDQFLIVAMKGSPYTLSAATPSANPTEMPNYFALSLLVFLLTM